MEDIAAYCSWADSHLQEEHFRGRLPIEISTQITRSAKPQYFDILCGAFRDTRYADTLFPLYKPLFPELVARWTAAAPSLPSSKAIATISCLARVLPFASYLRPHVKALLQTNSLRQYLQDGERLSELGEEVVHSLLLALFRIFSFERDTLANHIGPLFLSSFLQHPSARVRYLAIQSLCMTMHFADAYSEQLVETYIGKSAILGEWEGKNIDYRMLKLFEERRWKDLAKSVTSVETSWHASLTDTSTSIPRPPVTNDLPILSANMGGVLVPRLPHQPALSPESTFIHTTTATKNLHQLGKCLLEQKPILVHGPASSGKTSLVHEAARLLGLRDSMVVLHLNEQTDAKSLLGIHTSSTDGSSFIWQPGVLTKAMQQGRWVLIEDIDKAPPEVTGILRPILEHGELFLANRKEKVKPNDGFRMLATLKTSGNSSTATTSRYSWLLNPRIWNTVDTPQYPTMEIETLLRSRYPAADVFVTMGLETHKSLLHLYDTNDILKGLQTRKPTLRDLLNLFRRMVHRLAAHDMTSEPIVLPEQAKLDIFKDAVDGYAGYLNTEKLHELIAGDIAVSMGISPQQMRYCLNEAPINVVESNDLVQVGRSTLRKASSRRRPPNRANFALTASARRTLDRITAGAEFSEPCLLVGETGVGKTTLVQHVAGLVGQVLTVVNLSQQSEVGDLLGGLKPVTTRSLIIPTLEKFNALFDDTFSAKRNEKFQVALTKAVIKQNWSRLLILWDQAVQMAATSLKSAEPTITNGSDHASKKRKLETPRYDTLRLRWAEFTDSLGQVRAFVDRGDKTHAFAFVEGRLVQAVREGEWVLLDEINLAPSDTLDHIVSLLQTGDSGRPSLLLTEAGNIETIMAHPNFRLFAAMNPATDSGKKDLPPGLRSRFTEIYVPSGDDNLEDLTKIIQTYLGSQLDNDKRAALDLARSYLALKKLNDEHQLTDGAGETPHFSIRSLVRCLLYVSQYGASHGLRRAMYEGFAMSFFTTLSRASENSALPHLEKHLLSSIKNRKAFLSQQPKLSHDGESFIAFRHHLVKRGPMTPDFQPHYIRTPSVERNLLNLARAASMRRFPILLQGPTSAGKTSMVEYLAKLSGNKFVRINNHEHTDLQEYLGSYVSDADGKLVYREGVLVDALRLGHWIVLDELNLAPSDVLEALNRLLDDNRELLIPESQEIVRPHPGFMLFATQNPAGLYGGRKRLSRAFRNRFLEIHFDDIPENELEAILRERTRIAPSFCTKIVAVYKSLSVLRQSSRLFDQRNSFATLRDLFRWASRPVDDWESLAYHGFMLLAERVRDPAERLVVKQTIEKELKVTLDENVLYGMSKVPSSVRESASIVWTPAMRRGFVLVTEALKNNEPVLLVGETGCGKTQVCQVIAEACQRPLDIYNAHNNTETGDLIGSQRPVRNRSELANRVQESWHALAHSQDHDSMLSDLNVNEIIEQFARLPQSDYHSEAVQQVRLRIGAYQALFTWTDGALVRAMKKGQHFLLDEISLAEDSVLERLNSVLEPSRTMLLAEKGALDNLVIAHPDFQFLATMNPGGDYGKRELSAALRNRLTEIWMPPLSQEADMLPIVQTRLSQRGRHLAENMVNFAIWFSDHFRNAATQTIALRDLLAWSDFINHADSLSGNLAFLHGAFMVYVDSIGANPAGLTSLGTTNLSRSRQKCLDHLRNFIGDDVVEQYEQVPLLNATQDQLSVGPFSLVRSSHTEGITSDLVFEAPTTLRNTMRVVRALQMTRPILLEGNPGVGKTAIVTALAHACGKEFARINLSDQTDLMDLFGADAPAEGEGMGQFSWQDGPLLKAMQSGGWVLLDEMNLASQSVLEGLNACLDHRREVYIAELDRSFNCHPDFTLFAAQNPHHQGGGRKGLPASFVNRFTVVYADSFQEEDLMRICQVRYPDISLEKLEGIITTVTRTEKIMAEHSEFAQGGPWDVNLRDVDRWLRLCKEQAMLPTAYHTRTIFTVRLRTSTQRELIGDVKVMMLESSAPESFYNNVSRASLQIGNAFLSRDPVTQQSETPKVGLSTSQFPAANSVITAIRHNWPVIIAGTSGSGKTFLLRYLAAAAGAELIEFSMNADVDAMDLVGGFEQHDLRRDVANLQIQIKKVLQLRIAKAISVPDGHQNLPQLLRLWHRVAQGDMKLDAVIGALGEMSTTLPELRQIADASSDKIHHADAEGFRFVWNDGVLVDAIQNGSWLVLDNANLCNPSVLDRLNSLLEPNGTLTISEQHNGGSGTRTIKPHPNFRIFLAIDPRYGELSRAMRNRSLEVFLPNLHERQVGVSPLQYPLSSTMNRLRIFFDATSGLADGRLIEPGIDNLNREDMALMDASTDFPLEAEYSASVAAEMKLRKAVEIDLVRRVPGFVKLPTEVERPQMVLVNEPSLLLSGYSPGNDTPNHPTQLFMRCWYVLRSIATIRTKLESAQARAAVVSLRDRTILERSSLATNKKELGGMPDIANFAHSILSFIHHTSLTAVDGATAKSLLAIFEQMLSYTEDLLIFCDNKVIDTFYLQGYREVGLRLLHVAEESFPSLGANFSDCLQMLSVQDSDLTTGFSLQVMWQLFRPETPTTPAKLDVQLSLEELVARFDRICRFLPQSRSSLSAVRSNLRRTYRSIAESNQPTESLTVLQNAVADLELQSKNGFELKSHFEEVLRFLQDVFILQGQKSSAPDLELLSIFTARSGGDILDMRDTSSATLSLARIASIDASTFARNGSNGMRLIRQLSTVDKQQLGMLSHAQEELGALTKAITAHTTSFEDSVQPLVEHLRLIVGGIMSSHIDNLTPQAQVCCMRPSSVNFSKLAAMSEDVVALEMQSGCRFRDVYLNLVHPMVLLLCEDDLTQTHLQICLVNMSLAGLILMVPNKLFDPAIYPIVAHQHHERRGLQLSNRIQCQKEFHRQLTGNDTALLIRLLEQQLAELGTSSPPPQVIRPGKEEHFKLQEVFNRIVALILNRQTSGPAPSNRMGGTEWIAEWSTSQGISRLETIIERLDRVHRAYDDFVKPISWFLKSLHLGLKLACRLAVHSHAHAITDELLNATPLVSEDPATVQNWTLKTFNSDSRLTWFEHAGLKTALTHRQDLAGTEDFVRVLDSFYQEWKNRLTHDQAQAATQSRYYAYRGDSAKDVEEDDREMRELFPEYEGDEPQIGLHDATWDGRATAVNLSMLHQKIYTTQEPQDAMQRFVHNVLLKIANVDDDVASNSGRSFVDFLPAVLVQMEAKMAEMSPNNQQNSSNIYTDPDMAQSRKLFNLMQEIQLRFHAIQDKWPEHAIPGEVLSFCLEVLNLSFAEPVARLLTKTEKLFAIVTQWQSIASREWSVSELVDKLSSLIISWRRLELLSWSRLLDEEKRRHEDDAQAWYFIAYEAVVYNCRMINPEDGSSFGYRTTLARTLEEFFQTTTQGQYSSRLRLLATLNKTLQSLAVDHGDLQETFSCVQHVIDHYRRYEAGMEVSLQKGRVELEKALNEQIKLASWKDTNITALRDSARRSHHKLFKIVRKYRDLLNQVVVLSPPEQRSEQTHLVVPELAFQQTPSEQIVAAIAECETELDGWTERPERLRQPRGAAKSMQHLYISKTTGLHVHTELASFCSELDVNIKDLRKQTPPTLTEETAPIVRQLQQQKRRLFADTLKTIAHMGIRRNLPTTELDIQSSTATILASSSIVSSKLPPQASTGEDVFHDLLDCMSQVRNARAEHSDDLTDGEINRSIGLLEGFLSLAIKQWKTSPKQEFDLYSLSSQLDSLRSVAASPPNALHRSTFTPSDVQNMQDRLAWLVEIIVVGNRILRFQAHSAGIDFNSLIDSLESFATQITTQRKGLRDLRVCPQGLAWEQLQVLMNKTSQLLSQLGASLQEYQVKEPRVKYLLRKIVVWTWDLPTVDATQPAYTAELGLLDFDRGLQDTINQIFVALQRLASVPALPDSEEDQGWLIKSDKHMEMAFRSLQVDVISQRLDETVMSKLQHLSPVDLETAKNLLIVAMPIVEQYFYICEHLHDRYSATYLETCRLALHLARTFTALASQGFCRPHDPTDGQEEQSGKLESGTGLGEGEGAEDISKDVQDDEDLSELAQQAQKEEKGTDMENAEDAVDMGTDALEGEEADQDEKASESGKDEDRSGDEDENEIDEEAGSVDDLDPNAVDEKMWDDMKNESEQKDKEMKNDKMKGQKTDDQTTADGEKEEGDDVEGLEGEEQDADADDQDGDDGGERPEGEQMDAHVDEEKALDLPDELNLAGDEDLKDDDISDGGMDELSDIENPTDDVKDGLDDEDATKQDRPFDDTVDEHELDEKSEEETDGVGQNDEIMEDQTEEAEEESGDHDTRQDDAAHDAEENAGGESGAANEVQDNIDAEQDSTGMNDTDKDPNPEQSQPGVAPKNEQEGKTGEGTIERGAGRAENIEFHQNESLKKLADVLDQWHQRREILPATEQQDKEQQQDDVDMEDADFEHLQDEDKGNAQALGAAGVDQAQNLDQSKAIEDDNEPLNEDTALPDVQEPEIREDIAERYSRLKAQSKSAETREAGVVVPERQPQLHDPADGQDGTDAASDDLSPDIEHLELSNNQETPAVHATSAANAARLWHQCSTSTHQFSLVLTEQLRLILSPTTATKLRGDYRTGKRLNIKRIIPYIASNYKRDKIWMRRSVPSKRNYQIMIAVDDSKSMSESGADVLAFETLALLAKSLAMLEAGELCIVGFGDAPKITVAHPFGMPFSPAESGPQAFQAFSFEQRGTDVKSLVRQSIQLFRDAKQQRQGSGDEQWQLQLIVSDGHISDHEAIARLVRQAHDEERIVIVFVIVDAGQESILDLKEAVYDRDPGAMGGSDGSSAEMKLRMKRYLDGFPFPYYLVVRDVRDLPGVLATALKGWFGSVVDAQ